MARRALPAAAVVWAVAADAAAQTDLAQALDANGKQPSLRWTSRNGTAYAVSLFDGRTLSGTATLTQEAAGNRERDRPVELEKKP
mgnify:CR=1 FL=1